MAVARSGLATMADDSPHRGKQHGGDFVDARNLSKDLVTFAQHVEAGGLPPGYPLQLHVDEDGTHVISGRRRTMEALPLARLLEGCTVKTRLEYQDD